MLASSYHVSMAVQPIEAGARRLGRYVTLDRTCFARIGSWVTTSPEPEAKVLLAAHARHHAWRAEVISGVIPSLPDLDPTSPSPDLDVLGAHLEGLTATTDRLVAVYGTILPLLIQHQRAHVRACTDVSDAPVRRALRIVVRDALDDLQPGEALLARLGGAGPTPEDAVVAELLDRLLRDPVGIGTD